MKLIKRAEQKPQPITKFNVGDKYQYVYDGFDGRTCTDERMVFTVVKAMRRNMHVEDQVGNIWEMPMIKTEAMTKIN